jgi:hypothetical protein
MLRDSMPLAPAGGPLLISPLSIGHLDGSGVYTELVAESFPSLPPRQATSFARDGDLVMWLETSSTSLYWVDWWIMALEDGRQRVVAETSELGVGDALPMLETDPSISLAGRTVFWNTVIPREGVAVPGDDWGDWETALLSKHLGGGESITVVARGVARHRAGRPGTVLFVQHRPDGGDRIVEVEPDGGLGVVVEDASGGSDYFVTGVAGDVDSVVWGVEARPLEGHVASDEGNISWVYVLDVVSGVLTEVVTAATGADEPFVSEGWVSWGDGSGWGDPGEFLLDVSSGEIFRVGEMRGISTIAVCYPAVAWVSAPGWPSSVVAVGFLARPASN